MKIAICILNWNGKKLLERVLPSIVKFSYGHPIYLIDNNSQDNSIKFVKKTFSSIQIIKNNKNFGFSGGYNLGLKQVKENYYCLINSDVYVIKNWIQPVINLFQKDKNIAIVQPKILNKKNPEYFEYAGAAGGKIDFFGYPYCRGRIFNQIEKDKGQYNDEVPIFWASGACFFIRKNVFWHFNGFDDDFFAHMEEIDLCWRINNNSNQKIYYCGKSKVYHIGASTINISAEKTFLNFRNNLYMILKNLPKYQWIYILFCRIILDGVIGIIFLFSGQLSYTFSIIKAYLSFFKLFSLMYKKRNPGIKKYYQTFSIFNLWYINYLFKHNNFFVKKYKLRNI